MIPTLFLLEGLKTIVPLIGGMAVQAWIMRSTTELTWAKSTFFSAIFGLVAVQAVVLSYVMLLFLAPGRPWTYGWIIDTLFIFGVACLVQTLLWRFATNPRASWLICISTAAVGSGATLILCGVAGRDMSFPFMS